MWEESGCGFQACCVGGLCVDMDVCARRFLAWATANSNWVCDCGCGCRISAVVGSSCCLFALVLVTQELRTDHCKLKSNSLTHLNDVFDCSIDWSWLVPPALGLPGRSSLSRGDRPSTDNGILLLQHIASTRHQRSLSSTLIHSSPPHPPPSPRLSMCGCLRAHAKRSLSNSSRAAVKGHHIPPTQLPPPPTPTALIATPRHQTHGNNPTTDAWHRSTWIPSLYTNMQQCWAVGPDLIEPFIFFGG